MLCKKLCISKTWNAIKKVFKTIDKLAIEGYISVYKSYATKDLAKNDLGTNQGQVKKLRLVLN